MKFILTEARTRKTTTKVDIKLKDGGTIPAGTKGIVWPFPDEPGHALAMGFKPDTGTREYKFAMRNIGKYFTGFKTPTPETLMRWDWEKGGSKTPVGTWVEPDGHDPDGWPAWTMILGIL